jgi:glycosyltransferase involved in cell wall biosynthesis
VPQPAPAAPSTEAWPTLSIVMPVRNDARHLERAVISALAQEYPRPFDVVLAVGPSQDGTEIVATALERDEPRVRVVPNPAGDIPAGLNAAIGASNSDIVVRADAHCELPPGYLLRAVTTLGETGAVNVGGIQRATGTTVFERAVAAAMSSRFGTGDAQFHYGGDAGPTDTVYLGVFRRDALIAAGGYDETLLRNEDYELNWRLREDGGTVWFDPELSVRYQPRSSITALARQYFAYGQWKREVLRRHPRSLRWRQAVPPAALGLNIAGVVIGATRDRRALVIPAGYAAATIAASAMTAADEPVNVRARLPLVFATMHLSWGAGFLAGPPARARRRTR